MTHDPFGQYALPGAVIAISGDEDCWDGKPYLEQVSVQFNPRHGRHVNIGHQARRGTKFGRCEEFGGGRKSGNIVAQRSEHPSHRIAK
jgi:hypothetical protein